MQKDLGGQYKCPLNNTITFRKWGEDAWGKVYGVHDSYVNQQARILSCRLRDVTNIAPASSCDPTTPESCHTEEQKCQQRGQGGVGLTMQGSDEDNFRFTLSMECGFECFLGKDDVGEAMDVLHLLEDILRLAMDAGKSSHCRPYQPDETGDTAKNWHQAATRIAEKVIQAYQAASETGGSVNSVLETQEPFRKYMAKLFPPAK